MAAGSGVALAVGSGVGVGVGVGVGSGPTRMAVWPLTGVSDLSKSSMIPEKGYVFISAGAVTVYVKRSSPSSMKVTVWPSTSTAAGGQVGAPVAEPGGQRFDNLSESPVSGGGDPYIQLATRQHPCR